MNKPMKMYGSLYNCVEIPRGNFAILEELFKICAGDYNNSVKPENEKDSIMHVNECDITIMPKNCGGCETIFFEIAVPDGLVTDKRPLNAFVHVEEDISKLQILKRILCLFAGDNELVKIDLGNRVEPEEVFYKPGFVLVEGVLMDEDDACIWDESHLVPVYEEE